MRTLLGPKKLAALLLFSLATLPTAFATRVNVESTSIGESSFGQKLYENEHLSYDAAQGTVLLDATAGSDAGIDVVSSEYATIAAENTALERLSQILADQIVARVALFAERQTPDQ